MKKAVSLALCLAMTASIAGCTQQGDPVESTPPEKKETYTAGVYTGTSLNGRGGEVKVEVTFSDTEIESITILDNSETPAIATAAFETIPAQIVKHQSLAVEAVSGATITSDAVLEAVADAVKQANGDVEALKKVSINEEKKDETVEMNATVVVVGGGAAGMAAAMSSAYEGAESVILVEKEAMIGGNAIVSGGFCETTDRTLFPENNEGYTAVIEKFIADGPLDANEEAVWHQLEQEYADYLTSGSTKVFDSTLYHALDFARIDGTGYSGNEFAEYVGEFVRWFTEETGAEWNPAAGIVGYSWPRWSSLKGYYSGQGYFDYFEKWLEKTNANITILTSSPMTELMEDGNGKVIGIVAENKDGTTYHITADNGVILAAGGYAKNIEMVKETDGIWGELLYDGIISTNAAGLTGEGILIAQKHGAGVAGMENTMLFPMANIHTGSTESIVGTTASALVVNQEGERFVDETADRYTISGAMLAQTDHLGYIISSSENCLNTADGKTQGGEDIEILIKNGELYRADTLEKLAELTGIPADTLEKTVAEYNEMCATYKDPAFGRTTFEENSELLTGPFFAYPCKPATHITMGGLLADEFGRVLTEDGTVISGLYAAGEVTAGNLGIDGSFGYGKYVGKVVANKLDQ